MGGPTPAETEYLVVRGDTILMRGTMDHVLWRSPAAGGFDAGRRRIYELPFFLTPMTGIRPAAIAALGRDLCDPPHQF